MKGQTLLLIISLLFLHINCSWNVNCGTCNSCSSPCFQISDISTEVTNYYCSLNEKSCSSAFPAVIAESHVCSNLLKDQCKSCCFTFDSLERCADEFVFGNDLCLNNLMESGGSASKAEVGFTQTVGTGTYCYDSYGNYGLCSSTSSSDSSSSSSDNSFIGGIAGGIVGFVLLLICCCCCCKK